MIGASAWANHPKEDPPVSRGLGATAKHALFSWARRLGGFVNFESVAVAGGVPFSHPGAAPQQRATRQTANLRCLAGTGRRWSCSAKMNSPSSRGSAALHNWPAPQSGDGYCIPAAWNYRRASEAAFFTTAKRSRAEAPETVILGSQPRDLKALVARKTS